MRFLNVITVIFFSQIIIITTADHHHQFHFWVVKHGVICTCTYLWTPCGLNLKHPSKTRLIIAIFAVRVNSSVLFFKCSIKLTWCSFCGPAANIFFFLKKVVVIYHNQLMKACLKVQLKKDLQKLRYMHTICIHFLLRKKETGM